MCNMASAKVNKKMGAAIMSLPECPVCMEPMRAPIFQCQSGHSLCRTCSNRLCPPICPICRQAMTQMRNWQLEEMISKIKVPCPNKAVGCVYMLMQNSVEDHLKECIYQEMNCPIGEVFGKCSWRGHLKEMIDHFKERHPGNCNATLDVDVEINNININEDDRQLFLITQGKNNFILSMKIDTLQKMAYWSIQLMGSKKAAKEHIYEIHISSQLDNRRKVIFVERCFNYGIKADEIFRRGECGVLPLDSLKHFVKDKKLIFKFTIKKYNPPQKHSNDSESNENTASTASVPKGPAPKGLGPKKPGQNFSKLKGPKPEQN